MTSYFSSITSSSAISNLGTRLNSFRRAITLGDEADDPDNEDASHISNVLRAYYTEKGRPYPSWLPPDPKERSQAPSRVIATATAAPSNTGMPSGRVGGLGDLWGEPSGAAAPAASQTASLRRGRNAMGSSPSPPISQSSSASMSTTSLHPTGSRPPLPSQRTQSYQSSGGPPSLERAPSAQERLRARLHSGRSPSPGQYSGGTDPSARKPVGGRFR